MRRLKYMYGEELSIEFTLPSFADADKYFHILGKTDTPQMEEYIFNEITGSKYDVETLPAGVVIAVIFSAMKLAGVLKSVNDLPGKIESARATVNTDLISTFYSCIIKAMPSYNLDSLKEKTLNEIMELLAVAELVAGQPLIDLVKLRESLEIEAVDKPKKGLASTTKEEIQQLMGLMDRERDIGGPEI